MTWLSLKLQLADVSVSASPAARRSSEPAAAPNLLSQMSLDSWWLAIMRKSSTRADWHEWMRRLSIEMVRESPSA